jgi:hypothetical protein
MQSGCLLFPTEINQNRFTYKKWLGEGQVLFYVGVSDTHMVEENILRAVALSKVDVELD